MSTKRGRSYSRQTTDAAVLFGQHVQLARKERGLTEIDLADRAGISRTTLQKIEKGDLKCELGLYFEVATLVGIPLFGVDSIASLVTSIARVQDKLALLPKSVRKKKNEINDDF